MSNLALASTAIGIDIGTTYCYVGVYKNNSVEVIANEQGNRATPSFLSFTAKERVVGEAAYNHQHLNQANTIYHAKSLLGMEWKDPALQTLLAESKFPFKVLEGPNGRPVVEVDFQGKASRFTPEELVGVLFKQIKQTASQYMGANIDKAVVSVPPHYNDAQKQALRDAAKLGEIEVLALCDEPAAVAMAYKLDEPSSTTAGASSSANQHVVVVDCGGISTNITVLGVQNGIMEILGFDQDTMLGGEHIDEKMMSYFATEFKRKNEGLDLIGSARAMTRLRHGCEKAKVVLSAAGTAPIELDALYEGADLFSNMTRSKFEGVCADFFKKITIALERALKNAGVEKDDVQSLIISGGSGKIPKVKDTITRFFGPRVKLLTGVQSVDEAVAFGCAIQASLLVTANKDHATSDVHEVRMNALAIGVENAAGEMQVLIPKHTPLPTLKVLHASVASLTKGGLLKLYEGEVIKLASKNHLLGSLALEGLKDHQCIIEVAMDVDSNIELQVTHSGDTRITLHVPAGAKQLTSAQVAASLEAGHAEHVHLLSVNKVLLDQIDLVTMRTIEITSEVTSGAAAGALTSGEEQMMAKAVDDVTNWFETITVGPIVHAKFDDIDRKARGLELLFASCTKKIEAAKNAPAVVAAPIVKAKAPVSAPAPMMMMDTGDLD